MGPAHHVDLGHHRLFAAGHLRGSLSFDSHGNAVTYLGWLIEWGAPLTPLGADVDEVAEMQRELVRIGIDRPAAYAVGSPTDWASDGVPITSYPRRTHADLARAMAGEPRPLVLDVRRNLEHADGYVLGAKHVPLHELVARQGEVATWAGTGRGPVWVYCGSGFRAAVAASLLERIGVDVVHVDDEFANAAPSGVPLARTEVGQTLGATYTD